MAKKEKGKTVADKRVRELLDFHVGMLGSKKNKLEFDEREKAYYLKDVPWSAEDDYFRIGYNMRKRFISRTFDLVFSTTINDVDFNGSFDLRLKFTGFPNVKTAYFKAGKGKQKYEKYFNDEKLLATLRKYASIVDIGYIVIEYNEPAGRLKIKVCPYPGAYLWIIFPPVFYKIPLKDGEMEALWNATMELRKFVCKRY
ncbi:MAG: hypothetical protein Q4A65_06850 [Bacillota bacterium]|nr:hypothetical protein [Bacillota bacterium]